jgi:hypothetical protein
VADAEGQTNDYCRRIERYLCQKNDGHLIRITGPSFDRVSTWADRGVPFSIACRGIDRYFERYYARGPRRRPVRIDFFRRLTSARANGVLDESFDDFLDRVAAAFETARGSPRGPARRELVERLTALDAELIERIRARLGSHELAALQREADDELAPFRAGMGAEAYERARDAAVTRFVRERQHLPTIAYL